MSESSPIRVFARDGRWLVDYGSYVCTYCSTRSQAVAAGTDAARDEHRGLVIDDAPPARVESSLQAAVDESDLEAVTREDLDAYAEDVRGRIAGASNQIFAHFLEDFDPETATDDDVARGVLLADLANAAHDPVPLTEHEEAQLDHLIAAQHPRLQETHTEVRKTDARHVLHLLRAIEVAKTAGTYNEPHPAEPEND